MGSGLSHPESNEARPALKRAFQIRFAQPPSTGIGIRRAKGIRVIVGATTPSALEIEPDPRRQLTETPKL